MIWEFKGLSGRRLEFDDVNATVLWQEKQGHAQVVRTNDGHYVYLFGRTAPDRSAEELGDKQLIHLLAKMPAEELSDEGLSIMEAAGWPEQTPPS